MTNFTFHFPIRNGRQWTLDVYPAPEWEADLPAFQATTPGFALRIGRTKWRLERVPVGKGTQWWGLQVYQTVQPSIPQEKA